MYTSLVVVSNAWTIEKANIGKLETTYLAKMEMLYF